MVELVVVIIILAVLAAVAAPRLVGRTGFESRGFYDEVASAYRYGQRSAIALRRTVTVSVSTPSNSQPCALRLCLNAQCTLQVLDPATNAPFCLRPPSLVTLSGPLVAISFDSRGRPSNGGSVTVASSAPGDSNRTITIETESGYVR
jgi:MSHA pilin protein MshC